jgi:cell division protein FtsL
MTSVESVLVIFLAVALLLFLILAIVMAALAVGILKNVKHISQKAEETTANLSDIAKMVGKRVAPVALSAAIAAAIRRFRSKK